MPATILPKFYALTAPGGQLLSSKGAAVLTPSAGVTAHHGYVIGDIKGGVSKQQAYAALVNPASIPASASYAVHRNDVMIANSRGYAVLQTFYPPYEELNITFPFSENQFPVSLSYGSSGGPGFKTSVFTVDSGVARTNAEWDRLRARYTVDFDGVPYSDIQKVENFFYGMRGMAIGFRFKDWNDYQIVKQNVVVGDGVATQFQLFKRYRSGGQFFDRIITKPVRGSFDVLFLDGVEMVVNRDFFVNYSTGIISFVVAPPSGSVGNIDYCEFDVPVRFDTDELTVSAEDHNQYSISSLELIEILL